METLTKKDLEPIVKAVDDLTGLMKRIETALLGDEKMHLQGIASKVAYHESYISKNKQRAGWIIGASTGFGAALHGIWDFLKSL